MMNDNSYDPREYIGSSIKSDAFIDLLEGYELEVLYDFDRTHENIDDVYWIHDKERGCTFMANKEQTIVVAFVYLRPLEDHKPFPRALSGITLVNNRIQELGEPSKSGSYKGQSWVRYDRDALSMHYSWDEVGPRKITFAHPSSLP